MTSRPDAAGLVERVQALLAKRRARDAEALCRQSIDTGEALAEAWLALGLVFTSERRFDLAADAYRRSLAATVSPWACLYLALSLHELGETDAAIHEAGQAVAMAPDLADAHGTLATVLHGVGRSREALASTEQALRLAPDSHVIVARLAAIRAELGLFDEAEAAYRQAEALAPAFRHFGLIGFSRGLWDDIVAAGAAEGPAPAVVRESAAAPACPRVALASCDGRYFTKYAGSFLNSFAANAADTLLHLHVFDPGPDFPAELDALIERTGVTHFRISAERAPVDHGDTKALRTYYSCGRFLILPQLLEQYQRPIVSLDIDATLTGSLEPLVGSAFDVALLLRKPLDAPWLDVLAGVAVATPSPSSREFWSAVRGYLLHFMGRGAMHWHLDQVALYCVLKMAARFGRPPTVQWLNLGALDMFWHVGHSHDYRMADERYKRYALPGASAD